MSMLALCIIAFFILFGLFFYWTKNNFYLWIRRYWFFYPTRSIRISDLLYIVFFGLLVISLFASTHLLTKNKSRKILIVIDASTSMLGNDIYPSRIKKAIHLSHSLIKENTQDSISISHFDEEFHLHIPFNNDTQLQEKTLVNIESLLEYKRSSNISNAIMQIEQYLERTDQKNIHIVILSDFETMNKNEFNLSFSKDHFYYLLPLGTMQGSSLEFNNIPLIYKKSPVISSTDYNKLRLWTYPNHNVKMIQDNNISWMGQSILQISKNTQTMPFKPLYVWLAFIALFFSYILKFFPQFRVVLIYGIVINSVLIFSPNIYSFDQNLRSIHANNLRELGHKKKALIAYEELLDATTWNKEIFFSLFNYATLLLEENDVSKALKILEKMDEHRQILDESLWEEISSKLSSNIFVSMNKNPSMKMPKANKTKEEKYINDHDSKHSLEMYDEDQFNLSSPPIQLRKKDW